MRKNLLVTILFIVFGAFPVLAFADEPIANTLTSTDTTASPTTATAKSNANLLGTRPTIHQEMKDAKETMHADMVQARTDFKTKLSEIKDQRKQTIVTNLDNRISTMNKKRTDEMSTRLDRLTSILGKISTKESSLTAAGKNTVALKADILAAQTAIDAAKEAVTDQASKDYIMTITTDTALKGAASTTILQFVTDIKIAYTKVVAAQAGVVKAYSDASKLLGTTITPSPSVSPAVSPTTTTTP